jgi:hypothetical protein
MDTKYTIEQFDNGITLRWSDIDRDRAIVIPDHSINAEVGKIIIENVKSVMDMNTTNKIILTTILEAE